MRILFVFPDLSSTTTDYTGALSYGIASLTAVLRRAGHTVDLEHLLAPPSEGEFRARIRAARPDLVAFSSNSHYARRLATWTRWAHEAAGVPVAVGGIHATLVPDEVAALPSVDFTCVGEGEDAMLELCVALESGSDPTRIPNLIARSGSGLVRNPTRPILANLDLLPDPDLSIFDFPQLFNVRRGTFSYLMSRGCAYGCTYCCVHSLRDIAPRRGRYWRFLSPCAAADQLARLIARHMPDAADVNFVDAILFPDLEWLGQFAPLYRERVGLPFSCNMRADRIDEHVGELLQEMGCRVVRLGVESGDERITRTVLNRSLDLEDIRRAFAILRRHGIARWSYNMVGLPTETLADALKTVRLNAELDPELALQFMFYPYPGTELHRRSAREGLLTDREYDHYQVSVALRMPQFRESDVLFVNRLFRRLIRLYAAAGRAPRALRSRCVRTLDAALTSPLLPRAAIVRALDAYRGLRHRLGERLVRRSPALYRLLGGRAPMRPRPAVTTGPP